MTLRMDVQTTSGGPFTEINLAEYRFADFKLRVGYSHAMRLTWTAYEAMHNFPLYPGNFIRFWDDEGVTADGAAQSAANPLFEGFIDDASPGESDTVLYLAQDQTARASREIPVMSGAWRSESGRIVEAQGAVPRLVYNCKIDNDPDFAFERAHDGTLGEIIAGLLDDATLPLRYFNAAPSGSAPYVSSELDNFTFRPQEKMVFDSEQLRDALERLLAFYEPAVRIVFVPGASAANGRKWRFLNLYDAPQTTLTLNDFTEANENKVLAFELERSLEGRYTAVKIYGPEQSSTQTFQTSDGSLTITESVLLEQYNNANGLQSVYAPKTWQITDDSLRRGSRLLPEWIYVPENGIPEYPTEWDDGRISMLVARLVPTRWPSLQVTFDDGQTWVSIRPQWIDFSTGTVGVGDAYPYLYADDPPVPNSTQRYFVPTNTKLIYASYTTPLSVRSPTSGYSGTAYDIAGNEAELKIYQEMLAVGYERGQPVTTVTRLAQYQTLADAIHRQRKDVIYTGGCVLDGMRYEFSQLWQRINFAGVDQNGETVETGWESIGAALTDVEYDFEQQLTTLLFSTDQMELMGFDVEFLRRRLGIRALMRIQGDPVLFGQINVFGDSWVGTYTPVWYVDPYTGQLG